jgi:hypothetical protein
VSLHVLPVDLRIYGRVILSSCSQTIKSKARPVTGCGGLQGCEMLRIPHCLDIGSQMAVRLSALSTGRALLPSNIIFLLLMLISVRG